MNYTLRKSQLLTRDAFKYKDLIEESLSYAGINPAGMKFSISKRHEAPYAIGTKVCVPGPDTIDIDSFVNSVAHEAKHVEFNLNEIDLPIEDLEKECRKAGGQAQQAYEKVHGVSPMMAIAYGLAKVPHTSNKPQKKALRANFVPGVKKLWK